MLHSLNYAAPQLGHLHKIFLKCWYAALSGIWSVHYRKEKQGDAGASPVPE